MPLYANPIAAHPEDATTVDAAVTHLVHFFVQGKFYALFSLLFGIGFAIQMDRATARGGAFLPLYLRRMAVLAMFGAAHILFVWPGDILATYAVLGLVLLAFRDRQPRTLLAWAAGILLVPMVISLVQAILAALGPPDAEAGARLADAHARAAAQQQVYGHGGFLDVTRERAYDFVGMLPALRFMSSGILCMFLVGMWVARRRVVHALTANRGFLVRTLAVCAPLGVAANVLLVVARMHAAGGDPIWRFLVRASLTVGGPLLCFAYASGIALLATDDRWHRWMAPVRAAGKMALTNYLMQSIVCTTLFYGYGAGLLGRLGTAQGAALGVAVWSAELVWSTLWLRHFQYGPAEWLWRSLTYLRRQPMRRPIA